jgi:hypothetical protein
VIPPYEPLILLNVTVTYSASYQRLVTKVFPLLFEDLEVSEDVCCKWAEQVERDIREAINIVADELSCPNSKYSERWSRDGIAQFLKLALGLAPGTYDLGPGKRAELAGDLVGICRRSAQDKRRELILLLARELAAIQKRGLISED